MAKLRFRGAAQPVSQIDLITLAGTWSAADTATIKVAEKSVTYTAGASETPTTMATALLALCQASDEPEFQEVTWTRDTAVITATSTEGVPVTITVSEASASGAIGLANSQAATGPNHWDNSANWSTGAVPTTGDEAYFEDSNSAAMYGLPTALSLAKLVVRVGQVGLPDRNASGYTEYRTKRPGITCTDVTIGTSQGVGPSLCRLDLKSGASVVAVFGSLSRTDYAAVDLKLNNSSASVSVISGQVAIAASGDETSTLGTVRVAGGGAVQLGAGVTVTDVFSAGNCTIECATTTLTVDNGTATLVGSAANGTIEVRGGTLVHKTTGTITALTVGPGTIDCSQDIRARTITDVTIKKGGVYNDVYNSVTVTNGIVLGSDADKLVAQ